MYQKMKCVTLLLLFIAPFLNVRISDISVAISRGNQPSVSLNPDYTLSEPYAYYQKCGDYTSLRIKVQSPSNSYPTEVVATVNGTNHTMFLKFIAEDDIFYRNNIMTGVYYFGYL